MSIVDPAIFETLQDSIRVDDEQFSSSISTMALQNIVERLKHQRHHDTTRANYYCIWRLFNEFFLKLDVKPDNWEDRLMLFIGYLIETKKKSSTVKSYVSVIKAVLIEDGNEIKEDKFLFSSLTRACKLQNDRVRTKLPIRKHLLTMMI